ncbi:cytochrome c [Arenibacter sp. GZD96]|uniref:c-type cytochrome n=1 Tax=Aurantibrevibacter litoralis TaxID=3106030 RepID=UPI002AFE9724|nr:cytochrome c [Arenibacter sp. GZD-96]MEA1785052.1 cytochrome c [Arenibacter sp. GZD-96]
MKLLFIIYVLGVFILTGVLFQDNALKESMKRGSEIYADFCINCHLAQGEGVPNVFPPLANSDYLQNNRFESIAGVKYGQRGEIVVNGVTYNNIMMPMGLDDTEVADVMNFILNSWGNSSEGLVTPEEVAKIQPK